DPTTMPPNGTWRTSFSAAHADGTTTTYFVSVDTNSSSNPAGVSYNYGFLDTTGASAINRSVGGADGGSLDPAAKTLVVTLRLDKSPLTSQRTLDPIMVTDHVRSAGSTVPNRTIVSQLAGTDSLSSLTDDDGQTWVPNEGGGIVSGVDHQTIGAGPYHAPIPAN